MELGLSLGDASKSLGFLKQNNSPNQHQNPTKKRGFDFCMSLGLTSQERGKAQKSQENDDDGGGAGDDEEDDGDDSSDDNQEETETETQTPLQLNLLPLAPVPRQISSHLWSSDNGRFIAFASK